MKIKIILLFSILAVHNLYGQTIKDTTSIREYFEKGHNYKFENPDSAIFYYQAAYQLSQNIIKNSSLSPQQKSEIQVLKANSLRYSGIPCNNTGDFDEAIGFFLKAVDEYELIDTTEEKINLEVHSGVTACYNNIGISYAIQGNYASAIEYFTKSLEIFVELSTSSTDTLKIAGKFGMAASYNRLGYVYVNLSDYDNSNIYYSKSLEIAKELDDKEGIINCYNNIGGLFSDKGDYARAIEAYIEALKIAEEVQYKDGIFQCYNNIGLVHNNQKDFDQAMLYFEKSLEIAKELNDKSSISICYGNIGLVYHNQGKYKNAIEYYLKTLKIEEELQNIIRMAELYNNIGIIYQDIGEYSKADEFYTKTMKIDKESGDKNGIATSYGNLALLNLLIADSIKHNRNLELIHLNKAIAYGKQSLEIAQEIQAYPRINETAETLMLIYKKLEQPEKAFQYAEVFISSKDSMFNQEKTSAIANAEKKFESEKKQLQIEKLNKEKELQQSEMLRQQETSRRQRLAIFSIIAGLLLIVIFTFVIVNRLRITRKQKRIIEEQNKLVKEKNITLNQQNEKIEAQKEEITGSIRYAKRIQTAILPSNQWAKEHLPEHFILFRPRDIVSGDYYWMNHIGNKIILIAADCTGHGVPGAFMSMLGVSFLNEIVNKNNTIEPHLILNQLRNQVKHTLDQTGKEGEAKDGMDIAVCVLDSETLALQYAGAYNPLYVFRKGEIIEVKADKMPIGIYILEKESFTKNEMQLEKGDTFYIFSDGYSDQFGGPKGGKLKSGPFKGLLASIQPKNMAEQREILNSYIDDWMGEIDQIDDILVIGVKI